MARSWFLDSEPVPDGVDVRRLDCTAAAHWLMFGTFGRCRVCDAARPALAALWAYETAAGLACVPFGVCEACNATFDTSKTALDATLRRLYGLPPLPPPS